MPPLIVPTIHEKLLATLAVKLMFVAAPLHIAAVDGVVTDGFGLTVTVIV
jgi:hypothetical protein